MTPMNGRLGLAYLLAPWGATVPLLLVWLGVAVCARSIGGHYDLFITTPWHFAAVVVIAYVVGAALRPVYFVFERRGWRGWRFYIPTAILAAIVVEFALDAMTTSWVVTVQRLSSALTASSAEVLPVILFGVASGAACGGVFSLIMGWRQR
jgi:hypothetical protein